MSSVSPNDLTPLQMEKYQTILSQEGVVSTWFINLSPLPTTQLDGWLSLNIPDKDCVANVHAKYVSPEENGDYFWYGEVVRDNTGGEEDTCNCDEGVVSILRHQGEVIANLVLDGDQYEIQSLGEGLNVLVKRDMNDQVYNCGTNSEGYTRENQDQHVMPREGGDCTVRILALYTLNASNAVPNIKNTIELSIKQFEQGLRNSKIFESDLRVSLVDIQEFPFIELNGIERENKKMIGNSDLKARRNDAHADIVVVYRQGDVSDGYIGFTGSYNLSADSAVCSVQATRATSGYLTAHELGHVFGCHHHPSSDATGPKFAHGHAYTVGRCFKKKDKTTIVNTAVPDDTKIPYFSNPNVYYLGKATGIVDKRENWKRIINQACTVAKFRDEDNYPLLVASISGGQFNCPCFDILLEAEVRGGTPDPYEYEWRTSTDGFNWGQVESTSSFFSVKLPCEAGEGVYVKLRVMSSDGQVDDVFRYVEAAERWPGQQEDCPVQLPTNVHDNFTQDKILFPNPVSDKLFLFINPNSMIDIKDIEIVDLMGNKWMVFATKDKTESKIQISTSDLKDGMYFIKYGPDKVARFIKSIK